MAHPYLWTQEGLLCLPAQSQEHGGDTGDLSLHKESWTGSQKDINPAAGLGSALCMRKNRRSTARALQNYLQQAAGAHVFDQTVKNRLHEGGMKHRPPLVGPVPNTVTAQHYAARLAFAREHQNWPVCHWCPVLFTDESRFTLSTCESGDAVVNVMLLITSSSMTRLVVGQWWSGEANPWRFAQAPSHSQRYPDCC